LARPSLDHVDGGLHCARTGQVQRLLAGVITPTLAVRSSAQDVSVRATRMPTFHAFFEKIRSERYPPDKQSILINALSVVIPEFIEQAEHKNLRPYPPRPSVE
jgi:hypothetical protein